MCRTSPHDRPRFGLPALVAAALLVVSAVVPGLAAAQAPGPGTAAGFEIDGNLRCSDVITGVTAGEDWFANPPNACVGVIDAVTCQPNPSRIPALFQRDANWAGNAVDPDHFSGQ